MKIWVIAAGLALAAGAAGAEDWQLAGHQVVLESVEEVGYRLVADGAVVLEDRLILPDGAQAVAGGAVVYGVAGPGGNACDAAPFALWLPEGGPARLDGPIETCSPLTPEYTGGSVIWTSAEVVGRMTEHWVWTPEGGIVAEATTAFAPDAGFGWADLAAMADQHPSYALEMKPVYDDLLIGLGEAEFQLFAERIGGLGSGGMVGPDYYGEACIKEVCDTDFAGIWLEAAREQAFVFWKDYDSGAVKIYPNDRSLWPEGALAKLADHGG